MAKMPYLTMLFGRLRIEDYLKRKGFEVKNESKLLDGIIKLHFERDGLDRLVEGEVIIRDMIVNGEPLYKGELRVEVSNGRKYVYVYRNYKSNKFYNVEGRLIKKLSEVM